jgi:hypothetical protein
MAYQSHRILPFSGGRFLGAAAGWAFSLLLVTDGFSALPSIPPLSPIASAVLPDGWHLRLAFLVDTGSKTLLDGRLIDSKLIGERLAAEKPTEGKREVFILVYLGLPRTSEDLAAHVRQMMDTWEGNTLSHWRTVVHPASFNGAPDYSLSYNPKVQARLEQRAKAIPGTWELLVAPPDLAVMEVLAFGKGSGAGANASLRGFQIGFLDEESFWYRWRWQGDEPRFGGEGSIEVNRDVGNCAANYLLSIHCGNGVYLGFEPDKTTGETFATLTINPNVWLDPWNQPEQLRLPVHQAGPYRRVNANPLPAEPNAGEPTPLQFRRDRIFEQGASE